MFKRPDWMSFENFKKARREASENIKKYLKGRVIKGTESYYVEKGSRFRDTKKDQRRYSVAKKKKAYRKMRRKMAYKSKRLNRMRGYSG